MTAVAPGDAAAAHASSAPVGRPLAAPPLPPQQKPQALHVQVPDGAQPGDTFHVTAGDGRVIAVQCPPNAGAGSVVQVQVAPAQLAPV